MRQCWSVHTCHSNLMSLPHIVKHDCTNADTQSLLVSFETYVDYKSECCHGYSKSETTPKLVKLIVKYMSCSSSHMLNIGFCSKHRPVLSQALAAVKLTCCAFSTLRPRLTHGRSATFLLTAHNVHHCCSTIGAAPDWIIQHVCQC